MVLGKQGDAVCQVCGPPAVGVGRCPWRRGRNTLYLQGWLASFDDFGAPRASSGSAAALLRPGAASRIAMDGALLKPSSA